jgi:hypothetical protein
MSLPEQAPAFRRGEHVTGPQMEGQAISQNDVDRMFST